MKHFLLRNRWSSYEVLWVNVILFDRAAAQLRLQARGLETGDPVVAEAADFFGLRGRVRVVDAPPRRADGA